MDPSEVVGVSGVVATDSYEFGVVSRSFVNLFGIGKISIAIYDISVVYSLTFVVMIYSSTM